MHRLLVLLAFVGTLALSVSARPSAVAITGNYVEDFEHEYVGLVVFYDDHGEFSGRCSGSLLSPSIFLTAGHCVIFGSEARVYFEQDAGSHFDPELGFDPVSGYPLSGGYTGTAYDFGYVQNIPNKIDRRDIGAVVLDAPVPTSVVDRCDRSGVRSR